MTRSCGSVRNNADGNFVRFYSYFVWLAGRLKFMMDRFRSSLRGLAVVLLLGAATVLWPGKAEALTIGLQPFASGLNQPIDVTGSPIGGDGRLFVAQRGGVVRVVQADGSLAGGNFLDVSSLISTAGEGGLLGIALHPNYASNGFFYLYYTNTGGSIVIARYTVSGSPATSTTANAGSAQIILTIPHPGQTNHYGADLAFGPDDPGDPNDPYLFIAPGDGGGSNDPSNNAQNRESLLGKMLRIDINNPCCGLNYRNPPSNPFVGPQAGRDEVWDYGLRNPYRFSFDRVSKALYIGDVGQSAREEISVHPNGVAAPLNFGWRCFEGSIPNPTVSAQCSLPNHIPPSGEYTQNSPKAVTGGVVYRGSAQPSLYGYYLFADFYSGDFYTLRPAPGGGWEQIKQANFSGRNLVSFGENNAGEAFVADISNGTVYRITGEPYGAEWAGQSGTGPLVSGTQATVSIDYRNTGTQTWSSSGGNPVRLATSRPFDRTSPFSDASWLNPSRPTGITGQVNGGTLDTGDTAIEPGQIGRFRFTVTAPPVGSSTTFQEHFRLIAEGVANMENQGVHLPITVTGGTYQYQFAGQSYPPPVLNPGQTVSGLTFSLQNAGSATWRKQNAFPVRLGTTRPRDRASGFASGWLSSSRLPNYGGADAVTPGQTATFTYNITAPTTPGLHREYFEPVTEGFRWMGDIGMHWETYVRNPTAPAYDYQFVGQSPYPALNQNATATLKLQVRNTGQTTWQSDGSNPLRLGTERLRNRPSAFNTFPSWPSPSRIKLTRNLTDAAKNVGGETSVAEGEVAEFEFVITARPGPGQYPEYFAPVAEGITHLADRGIFWVITVR